MSSTASSMPRGCYSESPASNSWRSPFLIGAIFALLTSVQSPALAEENTYKEPPILDSDREHWAYQPIADIELPNAPSSISHPIDRFICEELSRHRLQLQSIASPSVIIRRLKFDLIGLPPTIPELKRVEQGADFESFVDEFLDRPGYGERWAQHWLDLARFAETDGFEHDKIRPSAWKYRDWVIQALNDNMPFDTFLRQQIAGDEIAPKNESAQIATMFCLSGPDMPDINLDSERRHTLLNEMAATVGEVFLGLQLGCAQCHDHKYDAISQADFYRFRAVFEPALQVSKNKSVSTLIERFPFNRASHLMLRGDFRTPGPTIDPAALRIMDERMVPTPRQHTAGLRTALANWMLSDARRLTARVIVNRVWQQHFAVGLVDTPSDFGIMGSAPSHPELLDWLADWFVDHNWNIKQLHRLILTSQTWRQRSLPENPNDKTWQEAVREDPRNRLLSRYPRKRLEGEVIRDGMLHAAGLLNRKAGGPGIRPPLPAELVETLLRNQWNVTKEESEHCRRSIYVFARRNLRYPIFEAFDRPSANTSCSQRMISTTAPQSLHLLNSSFSLRASQALADSIAGNDPESTIQQLFKRTLGRLPTNAEVADCENFLTESDSASPAAQLALSIFNCNEFIFVD